MNGDEERVAERLERGMESGPAPDPARLAALEDELAARAGRRRGSGRLRRWWLTAALLGAAATTAGWWVAERFGGSRQPAFESSPAQGSDGAGSRARPDRANSDDGTVSPGGHDDETIILRRERH